MAQRDDAIDTFLLPCGVELTRRVRRPTGEYDRIRRELDSAEGVLLSCRTTYPGRYRPKWIGFTRPSIKLCLRNGEIRLDALNDSGEVLIAAIGTVLSSKFDRLSFSRRALLLDDVGDPLPIIRTIISGLFNADEDHWGFFGAFGHDMALRKYKIDFQQPRDIDQSDIVLYIPDSISVCEGADFAKSVTYDYEFRFADKSSPNRQAGFVAEISQAETEAKEPPADEIDYKSIVSDAVDACANGLLFEVVGSKSFFRQTDMLPSDIFGKLEEINPSPYCFLANFGNEHIIGASPEMFVRVTGRVVETCPIAGTVRRGADAFEDADRILDLLSSRKVDAELTMCSDLDFDDKAKICDPLSIELVGRRQIELYSHVIHTVDHIRGTLAEPFDALDAFSAHLWAATLVGAPRKEALEFIEAREGTPRRWYGGAIGRLGFDGNIDTGIILRAMRLSGSIAEIRVGASLLHNSSPEEEEGEIFAKAAAMFKVVGGGHTDETSAAAIASETATMLQVVIVDLGGPFLGYLSGLLSSRGVRCSVIDHATAGSMKWKSRIAVLAPGLDDPSLQSAKELVSQILAQGGAVIGLGHGMLALAEHYGARSMVIDQPRHGVRCNVKQGVPGHLIPPVSANGGQVGVYCRKMLSDADGAPDLHAVWIDDDGAALAIEHRTAAAAGLLFQPQSVLSRPKMFLQLLQRFQERLSQSNHS